MNSNHGNGALQKRKKKLFRGEKKRLNPKAKGRDSRRFLGQCKSKIRQQERCSLIFDLQSPTQYLSIFRGNFPLPFTKQFQILSIPGKKPFENIVRKEKNAVTNHFLLFPQYFVPFRKQISILKSQSFYDL